MVDPLKTDAMTLTSKLAALQHRPRPLPLFLELLRRETAANPERMACALKGLRTYQEARREAPPAPMPAIAQMHGARICDYGGKGAPVLFIPSLINPPHILDLDEDRSLLRWLAGQGRHVLLLDWGQDNAARRTLSITGHIEQILLPLIRLIDTEISLVGYCLGGTMAMAAAMAAPEKVKSLVTIAAPWHFSGFPDDARGNLRTLWNNAVHSAEMMGLLPMEILQSAFWSIDPARTVSKFEAFAMMDQKCAEARAFIALEDWANDGPPISIAAARELFENFVAEDMPGLGQWQISGKNMDPAALCCPSLHIVSTTDRIVPKASAIRCGERLELEQGHVGMVIGSRARTALWEPLNAWLSRRA